MQIHHYASTYPNEEIESYELCLYSSCNSHTSSSSSDDSDLAHKRNNPLYIPQQRCILNSDNMNVIAFLVLQASNPSFAHLNLRDNTLGH